MKKLYNYKIRAPLLLIILLLSTITGFSQLPTVTTTAVSGITTTSAQSGGNVIDEGGNPPVRFKGIFFDTVPSPTANATNDGSGTGSFVSTLTGLIPNTLYYVRAYAINSNSPEDTAYGSELSFTTLPDTPHIRMDCTMVLASITCFIFKWDKPVGGKESYTYEIQVDDNRDFSSLFWSGSGISSDSTRKTITGVSLNTWYYFRIRATNVTGSGNWDTDSIYINYPMYSGKEEDGFSWAILPVSCPPPTATDMYRGGTSNGYSGYYQIQVRCPLYYRGGDDDGFVFAVLPISCPPPTATDMYRGGTSNGYSGYYQIQVRCPLYYRGGDDDGFATPNSMLTGCPPPVWTNLYYGGQDEGFSDGYLQQIACPMYYRGGDDDGFVLVNSFVAQSLCPPPTWTNLYKGGNDDGYSDNYKIQIACPMYYRGGDDDGFILVNSFVAQSLCPPPTWTNLYKGGNDDGYDDRKIIQVTCPTSFRGGIEDGFVMTLYKPQCPLTAAFYATDTTICAGDSIQLIDTSYGTPTKWFWSFPGGTYHSLYDTSLQQNPFVVYNTPGIYNVTLTIYNETNGYSSPLTKTAYIRVGSTAPATITPDGPLTFCEGDSVTLTASYGEYYSWTPNNKTTQSITVKTSGSYSVKVGCSSFSAPVVVTVNSNPTPVITSGSWMEDTLTGADSIQLVVTNATSYLWSTGDTTQSIYVNTTGTYYVTVTNANGCTASTSSLIIVEDNCQTAITHFNVATCNLRATPINNQYVLIEWVSPYDVYSDFYTIERGLDKINFDSLATIYRNEGHILSSSEYYSYMDKEPYTGISYYRLKNKNKFGNFRYSEIIEVMLNISEPVLISIYPNPTNNYLEYLFINEYKNVKVEIYIKDILGRDIIKNEFYLETGEIRKRIDVSYFGRGVYITQIKIKAGLNKLRNNSMITRKFIKS